jgi:hypothetical protein
MAQAAQRQFGAHVHGAAQLNIAKDTNEIDAALDIPGNDLLGFEHEPKTAAEKLAFDKLMKDFKNTYEIFSFDSKAKCKVTERKFEVEKVSPKEQHMDFNYTVKYDCSNFEKVKTIDVNLFKDFKSLREIKVQLVVPDKQSSQVLTPQNSQIQVVD